MFTELWRSNWSAQALSAYDCPVCFRKIGCSNTNLRSLSKEQPIALTALSQHPVRNGRIFPPDTIHRIHCHLSSRSTAQKTTSCNQTALYLICRPLLRPALRLYTCVIRLENRPSPDACLQPSAEWICEFLSRQLTKDPKRSYNFHALKLVAGIVYRYMRMPAIFGNSILIGLFTQ